MCKIKYAFIFLLVLSTACGRTWAQTASVNTGNSTDSSGSNVPVYLTTSFTVNDSVQCISGNSFVFTNQSSIYPPVFPMAYAWDFGNGATSTQTSPTVTYAATGTYTVTLIVTYDPGMYETTETTAHVMTVMPDGIYGFAVNNATQDLAGNDFVFTSNTPVTGNTYAWDFGDGTTSTVTNPDKVYAATGTYTVTQTATSAGGCVYTSTAFVTVATGDVGGGGGGGLESGSMGDLVTRREYDKMKNSISSKPDYNVLPIFGTGAQAKTTAAGSILQKLIPASLDAKTTARVSTPADITTITSAVDVFSLDYTYNNKAKAVVLGITTLGHVYNHTKSICDRFRGAVLSGTKIVNIEGYNFIQFTLAHANGDVEYCIAFTAGRSAGSSNYRLQSKWLLPEYTGDDSVFNFQVWAARPEQTISLTSTILSNLKSIMPVQQADADLKMPPAYITYGKRNKGFLDINIASARMSGNARIVFLQRTNELAVEDSLIVPLTLTAGTTNKFSIQVNDGYEYEGYVYLDDTLTDGTYMADGNWSLDYDKTYTTLNEYKPGNNPGRVYTDGEYPIYRSIKVAATSTDYISIFKFITAGEEPVDLTGMHSYKFYAQGTGNMQVSLLKDGITKWHAQYHTTVALDPKGKYYTISLDDFVSDETSEPFTPNDVKAVVYTASMNGLPTEYSFFADEQSFSPTAVVSVRALEAKGITVYPNPSAGSFECKFASTEDRNMSMTFTDITGKVVYTQPVHATTGINTISVTLPATAQSLLLVKMGNEKVQYDVTKLSILK